MMKKGILHLNGIVEEVFDKLIEKITGIEKLF